MTRGGESRKKAIQTKFILSTKATLNLGTWNVRTTAGKTVQVAVGMRNYHLDILGIRPSKWTGSEQKLLTTRERSLFYGHEKDNAPHTEGVALMLSKAAQKAFIGWGAHGPRIVTASFTTSHKIMMLNIFQCYAPTNDIGDEIKNQFYDRLLDTINSFSDRDISILIGDFNAKVGNDNRGYENQY